MSTMESTPPVAYFGFVPSAASESPPTVLHVHRFSVDEYERLGDMGMLPRDKRTELLEGVLVDMMSPGSQHSLSVDLIYRAMLAVLPRQWSNSSQRGVVFSESLTEPDGCVLRGELRTYRDRKPHAADVAIIIEVSDTSLLHDRSVKQMIYAAAGIPEYWIVNLPERKLEIYRKPLSATADRSAIYETVETYDATQSIKLMLDGVEIGTLAVRDILP